MTANRLMLNKQCLVPGQRPMDLIRAQSDGNETTGGCRVLGTEEPGGARRGQEGPGVLGQHQGSHQVFTSHLTTVIRQRH